MNPFLSDEIARQHIEALLRTASLDHLAASPHASRPSASLRRAIGMRLVNAGLVLIDGRPEPLTSRPRT